MELICDLATSLMGKIYDMFLLVTHNKGLLFVGN